jgi:hypothetical protein
VLIMDAPIPGPSAALGTSVQRHDLVTLVGLQAIDADGTLLRGRTYHDHATPKGALGGVVHIQSRPAGCVFGASSVRVEPTQLSVRCGLVPGASGEDCSPSKAAPRCCSE